MAGNKAYRRTRNLFDPQSREPFSLSRSRLENFIDCPRCFYLDRRLGIDSPGIPAFTLNSAVDELLKREFDAYRVKQQPHPLLAQYNLNLVPFAHPLLDEWRNNFKGVQYHHSSTNFIVFGAVDDIWVDAAGMLFVVDYKSTSTSAKITLDSEYRQSFKRQMEIYQWLLRKSGFTVSDTGYFVFCNADKTRAAFDNTLSFKSEIISYEAQGDWIEPVLQKARECLMSDSIPEYSPRCEHCSYRKAAQQVEAASSQGTPGRRAAQGELFA